MKNPVWGASFNADDAVPNDSVAAAVEAELKV